MAMKGPGVYVLAVWVLGTWLQVGLYEMHPSDHKMWISLMARTASRGWIGRAETVHDYRLRAYYVGLTCWTLVCFVPLSCYHRAWGKLTILLSVTAIAHIVAGRVL
jgi:hypothetical protein